MKTIQIQGQTIELPFTEAEYQKIIEGSDLTEALELFKRIRLGQTMYANNLLSYLAIGLHLAEKEKQGEVDKLRARVKELEAGLADFKKEHESIVAYYKEQVACLKEEFKVRFRLHQKRKTV